MHLVFKTGNVINFKKGVLFNTSLGVPSGLLGTLPWPALQEKGEREPELLQLKDVVLKCSHF